MSGDDWYWGYLANLVEFSAAANWYTEPKSSPYPVVGSRVSWICSSGSCGAPHLSADQTTTANLWSQCGRFGKRSAQTQKTSVLSLLSPSYGTPIGLQSL